LSGLAVHPAPSPRAGGYFLPLTLAALLGLASGCKGPEHPDNTSSGSLVAKGDLKWPEGVPRRVAVLPLEGNKEITT